MKKESAYYNEMPYERFIRHGPESLTNAELLALILRTGTESVSATALGQEILSIRDKDNTSLSVLYDLRLDELLSVRGIGQVKAVKLLCLAEVSKRMSAEKAKQRLSFRDPATVADYYMERLRHEKKEICLLLLLDQRLSLLGETVLSQVTVNTDLLSAREVFVNGLSMQAVNIMLLHNHPSGDPDPSGEDIEITEKIRKAGHLLGIELIDHLVIGDGEYRSLRQCGYLDHL